MIADLYKKTVCCSAAYVFQTILLFKQFLGTMAETHAEFQPGQQNFDQQPTAS